jgi:programmed cell death protein 5
VNTLALTKPEKAQMVENHLIQLARTGQLMGKFGEDQLISLLEKLSQQTQKKTVVNYDRRRVALDSDED